MGKIVVGGSFNTLSNDGTTPLHRRVNADGSLDPSFDPGTNGLVRALAIQSDSKILVRGDYDARRRQVRHNSAQPYGRLNADGSLDTSFNPERE